MGIVGKALGAGGFAVVTLLVAACSATVGTGGIVSVPSDSQDTCKTDCSDIGMTLASVVIMANQVGCVCNPKGGTTSHDQAAAAAGGGMAAVLAEEEAQRRAAATAPVPACHHGGPRSRHGAIAIKPWREGDRAVVGPSSSAARGRSGRGVTPIAPRWDCRRARLEGDRAVV
jgi:hypothetical protein